LNLKTDKLMVAMADERCAKLEVLLGRLQAGKDVQNRDLRRWLSAEEFTDYVQAWDKQLELRAELKDKPTAVTEYEAGLRKATLAYNKGEGARTRGKSKEASKHFAHAEALFERLHVYLDEIIAADAGLLVWFDRDLDSSAFGFEPGTVPVVVTSRSLDNNGGGLVSHKRTKRDIKLDAVECAIRDLELKAAGADERDDAITVQLESFLKLRDDDVI
jgi:hypothetical protein